MAYVDFVGRLHTATTRDYIQRVVQHDKAECAEVAGRFEKDYWDGERRYGFGGYHYDGRWRPVAEAMIAHYDTTRSSRVHRPCAPAQSHPARNPTHNYINYEEC